MPPLSVRPPIQQGRLRNLWITAGAVFLLLGIAGIFLPLLPTTPFLLLTAACWLRGSDRLHQWLLDHRLFGPMVRRVQSGEPLPAREKTATLLLLWASLALSAWLAVPSRLWGLRLLLLAIGLGVTWHVLAIGRRRKRRP